MAPLVVFALTCVVLGVTLWSCVTDFRTMRIPNSHSLVIIACFLVAWLVSPETFGKWWNPFGAFALMFAATFGMFCLGMFGSGDTKLSSVLALWVGLGGLMVFLFYMSLAGGLLGGIAMYIRKKKPFPNASAESWVGKAQSGKSAVPYGIAITAGAWAALFHSGFINHRLDEVIKIIH